MNASTNGRGPYNSTRLSKNERICPTLHVTIADAIRCAEKNLGIKPGQKLQPYWGTTRENEGLIVGWQNGTRLRWRLDYEPGANGDGPHINEENFAQPKHLQKMRHKIERPPLSGELMCILQWKKWTAAGNVDK